MRCAEHSTGLGETSSEASGEVHSVWRMLRLWESIAMPVDSREVEGLAPMPKGPAKAGLSAADPAGRWWRWKGRRQLVVAVAAAAASDRSAFASSFDAAEIAARVRARTQAWMRSVQLAGGRQAPAWRLVSGQSRPGEMAVAVAAPAAAVAVPAVAAAAVPVAAGVVAAAADAVVVVDVAAAAVAGHCSRAAAGPAASVDVHNHLLQQDGDVVQEVERKGGMYGVDGMRHGMVGQCQLELCCRRERCLGAR